MFVDANQNLLDSQFIFFLAAAIVLVALVASTLFLLRSLLHYRSRETKAFRRVVLQILVPKERKKENPNADQDRLEQVREEIAITETFFASLAGLRAQRGLSHWLGGRTDYFSFEIVAYNNLICFYVDTPARLQPMIEQQLHAQYPYAQIDEMVDYNVFHPHSAIMGAYLTGTGAKVFPFKSYKTMDSDPLAAILNTLGKMREGNSAAAVQYIVRSAHKRWRRPGTNLVREVRQGEKIEIAAHRSAWGRWWHNWFNFLSQATSKKTDTKETPYEPSEKEKEMLKGVEEKIAKGGLDVTIRLLTAADTNDLARQCLDDLTSAFSQYNTYRYGNSFTAVVPRNQGKIIRDFIYRSFNDRRHVVVNTEEMASLWHLPLPSTEAPFIKWLSARKAPPPSNIPTAGILLGHVRYRGDDLPIRMKEADRRRHLYVIGKSGVGKTVFIQNLAIQDIEAGHGVGVIDPHGALVEHI